MRRGIKTIQIPAMELSPGMFLDLLGWREIVAVKKHRDSDYLQVEYLNPDASQSQTTYRITSLVRVKAATYDF